jgi:S1-C subfamily serine protease
MGFTIVLTSLVLGWADPPAGSAPAAAFDIVSSIETVVADAIERAEPSVVAIARDKAERNESNETLAVRGKPRQPGDQRQNHAIFNMAREYVSTDYGSGVVIGDRGEILTAFHVVRGASFLMVRAAGHLQFEAEVLAADPRSDLAVIAPRAGVGAEPPKLKPIAMGDAGKLRKGAFLIALGNPFNAAWDGRPSASWGILSNVARRIEPHLDRSGDRRQDRLENYPTLLQLDSKLNLGMSGGAIVNMRGELVGLTTTSESPAGYEPQAGYAIPIDRIGRRVIETLRQGKEVEYGLLGIQGPRGEGTSRVQDVVPNSPAAEGKLQAGDEIVAVNDVPIANFEGLILAIHEYSPGESVRLKIVRDGKPLERTVVLAKFPVDGEIIATNRPDAWRGIRTDYMNALNYPSRDASMIGTVLRGVVVTSVDEGSPSAVAGLKKGQLIVRVDDQPVRTPDQFVAAVSGRKGPVSLLTDRGSVTVGSSR